jgi:hypothetical protein
MGRYAGVEGVDNYNGLVSAFADRYSVPPRYKSRMLSPDEPAPALFIVIIVACCAHALHSYRE